MKVYHPLNFPHPINKIFNKYIMKQNDNALLIYIKYKFIILNIT